MLHKDCRSYSNNNNYYYYSYYYYYGLLLIMINITSRRVALGLGFALRIPTLCSTHCSPGNAQRHPTQTQDP